MDIMESASQGWWRPSPGSVYPLLDSMVQDGLLTKLEGKKYAITEKGSQDLEAPFGWFGKSSRVEPRSVDEILNQMAGYVSYLEDLSASGDQKLKANLQAVHVLEQRLSKIGAG